MIDGRQTASGLMSDFDGRLAVGLGAWAAKGGWLYAAIGAADRTGAS